MLSNGYYKVTSRADHQRGMAMTHPADTPNTGLSHPGGRSSISQWSPLKKNKPMEQDPAGLKWDKTPDFVGGAKLLLARKTFVCSKSFLKTWKGELSRNKNTHCINIRSISNNWTESVNEPVQTTNRDLQCMKVFCSYRRGFCFCFVLKLNCRPVFGRQSAWLFNSNISSGFHHWDSFSLRFLIWQIFQKLAYLRS